MAARVLQVSDLHLGSRPPTVPSAAIEALIERAKPELLVVSGDLAHRGRYEQIGRAAAFLRGFGLPVLAVPGNHDLPYTFPGRFLRPWRSFERVWETTEPVYRSENLLVIGLNSARPWRHQSGGLPRESLERATSMLAEAPPEVFRLVVFHHHLVNAPWRSRKRPLSHRGRVLRAFAAAGADVIAGGHIHQASVSALHDFEVDADSSSLVVATTPGLGRPRPRRRGETQGLQLYSLDKNAITIDTFVVAQGKLQPVGARRFPRTLASD